MRARLLVQAVVAGSLLVVAMGLPVEAQRGLGKGRGRQPPPAPAEQTKDPATKNQETPKEELGPGEYPFEGFLVLEAVNRGEGPQALAYYEKTAQEAEKQGNELRAARALGRPPPWPSVSAAIRRRYSTVRGPSISTRARRSRALRI
jgi:hypothetical protein